MIELQANAPQCWDPSQGKLRMPHRLLNHTHLPDNVTSYLHTRDTYALQTTLSWLLLQLNTPRGLAKRLAKQGAPGRGKKKKTFLPDLTLSLFWSLIPAVQQV